MAPELSRTGFAPRVVELVPGSVLGRYQIVGEIGRGGMATVYRARDLELDRLVALKVLPTHVTEDDRFVSRFLQEARTVARLSHPNIVQVHDIGQDHGAWYISMEMVPGQNLADYLRTETPNLEQAVRIVLQVAEAVAYTHEHGVMHRDLKPSNILMRGDHPVVIDFGLSKDLLIQQGTVLTNDGEMVGSPAYMSPEQAQGQGVDPTSDICSLGIVLYELISFKNPYLDPRSIHQTVINVIAAEPVPLRQLCPWVNKELAAVVHMAMAKERRERYTSMAAFAADLRSWLAGKPVSARPPGLPYHLRRFVRERAAALWVAGVTATFALAGLAWMQLDSRLSRTPWAVFAEEDFESPTPQIGFQSWSVMGTAREPVLQPSGEWRVDQGRLVGYSSGYTFCRSNQEFMGNLRLEFDVTGLDGTNHDFGVYLYGDDPVHGVRFTLGQWGTQRAGIETGGSSYQWLASELPLQAGRTYRVAVERDGQRMRLLVDGRLVDERINVLPPTNRSGYHLGFFTWNGKIAIDNVRLSRRTVALKASPTVVADAFLDEGLLDHAVNAYYAVVQSYPKHEVAQQAKLKLGAISMVRNQYKQAIELFSGVAEEPMSRDLEIQALLLRSIAEQAVGDLGKAQEFQEELVRLDDDHPANVALIQNQLQRIEDCLDLSRPMFYGCASDGEAVFRFLARIQPQRQKLYGPTHVRFVEALRLWGPLSADSSFLSTELQFDQYYADHTPEIAAQVRLVRARHLRDLGRLDEAYAELEGLAKGDAVPDAVLGRLAAMVELGRTLAWEGRPADAERWLRQVVESPDASPALVAQAQLEWGIATILARQNALPRWQAILDLPGAPWILREQALFLAGKIDASGLRGALQTPEGLSPELPLILALGALEKNDLVGWYADVDEYVRRYPFSPALWELRRVTEWARTRTPHPTRLGRR